MNADPHPLTLPRLPVLGWEAFAGARDAPLPCVLDHPNVLFTTSGRAAITLALRALGVVPGDRVLVPTYHCPTMVAPVPSVGAEPIFFPLTDDGAPDLERLRRMDLGRARVMLAAHYFGLPQRMPDVRRFCDERGIALVEDCAHAFFGVCDGRTVGGWGDYAIASLPKFFPVSEGGCLVSAARPLDGIVLARRSLGQELKALANTVEMGSLHRRFPGLNGVMRVVFALQAALRDRGQGEATGPNNADDQADAPQTFDYDNSLVGARLAGSIRAIVRLVHRARITALRRRNYDLLAERIVDLPGATPLCPALPEHVAPYVFPLRVANPEPRYRALRAARVPLFRWDQVWPGMPRIPDDRGLAWSTEIFQLGCHQDLTEADIETLADTVRRVFQGVL